MEMKDHPSLMVGTPRGTHLPFDWMVGEFAGKIKDCQRVAKAKAAAPAGSQSKKRRSGELTARAQEKFLGRRPVLNLSGAAS